MDLIDNVIALPLLQEIAKAKKNNTQINVIIDLNDKFPNGQAAAGIEVRQMLSAICANEEFPNSKINEAIGQYIKNYIVAKLDPVVIERLVSLDNQKAIVRIWPDFETKAL
jgi:hypothetical protein